MSQAEANYINHITIVGDESASMRGNATAFTKVYDNLVAHLVERSRHHDQETRITTYLFNSSTGTRCVTYDKDVLRVPSIAASYHPAGRTPLVDATMLALSDLRMIPQKYGSHAFLTFVLTDGQENASRVRGDVLSAVINSAPDNETYAVFVPDQHAVFEAKKFGFPAGNISVWDTTRTAGVEDAGATMRAAAETFMTGRARGVHGYRGGAGLFTMQDFSVKDVKGAAVPLTAGSYFFLDVPGKASDKYRIDEFVGKATGKPYVLGRGYYQFMKPETIQPGKGIAVEVVTEVPGCPPDVQVYTGPQARTVLGLPDGHSVRVRPNQKAGCTIFVQSTSYNRNLVGDTRLLVLR